MLTGTLFLPFFFCLPLAHSDVVDYYLTCSRRMNSPFQQVASSVSSFAVACFRNISQYNYSVLSTSTDSLKVSPADCGSDLLKAG